MPTTYKEAKNLFQFLELVKDITGHSDSHARLRWWFRGQGHLRELNPVVFRTDPDNSFKVPNQPDSETHEERRIRAERHLFREFNDYAHGLVNPTVSEHEMYFVQRHYGMPSRLLDWSLDPLVALYFAATSKRDTDACVFLVDAYGIVSAQDPSKERWGIGTLKHREVQDALNVIAWETTPDRMPKFHFPIQVAKKDVRIVNQAGCFTFHIKAAPKLPDTAFNEQIIKIPKADKSVFREELKLLQFHPFRVYGDLGSLADTIIERVME
jgi:hypothetical protein